MRAVSDVAFTVWVPVQGKRRNAADYAHQGNHVHTRSYGYWRIHVMLRRESWPDNQKRVYRIYRAEGLSLRLKRPKRNKAARLRQPKQQATAINQIWSMDFVADALFDGRRLRALTVVDNYTRESLAIDVGQSLKEENLVDTLNWIAAHCGLPETIKVDNGSEFISKVMDKWAYERNVELDFSRPGKPTDNAKVESFNGRFWQECLNAHWFLSVDDAKAKIEEWRQYYNEARPHSALQWAMPSEFAHLAREKAKTGVSTKPEFYFRPVLILGYGHCQFFLSDGFVAVPPGTSKFQSSHLIHCDRETSRNAKNTATGIYSRKHREDVPLHKKNTGVIKRIPECRYSAPTESPTEFPRNVFTTRHEK